MQQHRGFFRYKTQDLRIGGICDITCSLTLQSLASSGLHILHTDLCRFEFASLTDLEDSRYKRACYTSAGPRDCGEQAEEASSHAHAVSTMFFKSECTAVHPNSDEIASGLAHSTVGSP